MINLRKGGIIYWLYTVGRMQEFQYHFENRKYQTDLCSIFWGSTFRPLGILILTIVFAPIILIVIGADVAGKALSQRLSIWQMRKLAQGKRLRTDQIKEFFGAVIGWIKGRICPLIVFE